MDSYCKYATLLFATGITLMSTHQIHVFISHSWKYTNHYDTLARWIFGENWSSGQASLKFLDFSVPISDPIYGANNDRQLLEAINNKISRSHVIIIPTGMYANYSKWIQKEINSAKQFQKPILAVNPWGQERKASVVADNATDYSGWNKEPLVGKIWNLYNS
jgi:MTH538 TIR-like domain (DUF1863)